MIIFINLLQFWVQKNVIKNPEKVLVNNFKLKHPALAKKQKN